MPFITWHPNWTMSCNILKAVFFVFQKQEVSECIYVWKCLRVLTWHGIQVEQAEIWKVKCFSFPEGNLSTSISHPPSPEPRLLWLPSLNCTRRHKHTTLSPWSHAVCGNAHRKDDAHQFCFGLGVGVSMWPGDTEMTTWVSAVTEQPAGILKH